MSTIYCVDSSSLMWAMKQAYPIETFPQFWQNMSEAVTTGRLISVENVLDEIQKGDDDLTVWAEEHIDMFKKVDTALGHTVRRIIQKYPTLMNPLVERDEADPYLISLAINNKATVVTQEDFLRNNPNRIKIPNVCEGEGVPCIKILPMIIEFGWKF